MAQRRGPRSAQRQDAALLVSFGLSTYARLRAMMVAASGIRRLVNELFEQTRGVLCELCGEATHFSKSVGRFYSVGRFTQ